MVDHSATFDVYVINVGKYEGLDGGVWNSLISKNLVHYSLSLKKFAYSLKIIHYSLKC